MCLDSNVTCEHITGDGNLAGSILREAGFIYSDYRIDNISLKSVILRETEEHGNDMYERRDLFMSR